MGKTLSQITVLNPGSNTLQKDLVSIIVPAYNAASYIEETIQSIFVQTYSSWEIIIVNDGSTDDTLQKIHSFTDPRLQVIDQKNAGVAAARNKGFLSAKGEYVVFFDADDIMPPEFLAERVIVFRNDPSIGFVAGLFQPFPVEETTRMPAAADPENEILFSNPSFGTGPSTYMFRTGILAYNGLKFNEKLNSTADRFFILEVARYAKGKNIGEKGKLLYRVTSQSMSNNLTPKLIIDNEKFYYELKKRNLLPGKRRQEFRSVYFLSLAKGFGKVRVWNKVFKYLFLSFISQPFFFIKNSGKSTARLFRSK